MNQLPTGKELWERKQQQIRQERNQYKAIPTIGQIMQDRDKKKEENKKHKAQPNNSIELPQDVEKLITGPDYWVKAKMNRYKMLIRHGHLQDLLDLAEMAQSKNNPANWFACVAGVKMWERTLTFLAKCRKVMQTAHEVAQRLGTDVSNFIIKNVWRHSKTLQYAIQAQELATNKLKYFAWLCTHSEAL